MRDPGRRLSRSRVRLAAGLAAVLLAAGLVHVARAGTSILDYDESGRLDQLHKLAPSHSGAGAGPSQTDSSKTGASGTGAPATGSFGTGSSGAGSSQSGSPETGSSGAGASGTGSFGTGATGVGLSGTGSFGNGAGDTSKARGGAVGAAPGGGAREGVQDRAGANGAPVKFDPDNWFVPGEIVVANPPEGFEDAAIVRGYQVLEKLRLRTLAFELWRLKVPPGVTVPKAVAQLRGLYPNLLLDANNRYHPADGPDDSSARAAIGWTGIDAHCGEGIRIGMVDTPVDLTHPALAGQKVVYRSFIQPKRRPAPADHGTAIAAMLVGKPDPQGFGGLLPGAQLLAANIFTFDDAGEEAADVIAMVRALDWLAHAGVQAVNLSMAGSDNRILRFAIEEASRRGMVMVAAVGNWGPTARPAYPAAYPQSIGVTAVDAASRIYAYANHGSYVAFAAPGVQMWTAVPGGGKVQSGTSFAVPYVTALIGTEAAAGGPITADRFRKALAQAAVDLGPRGRDDTFGWGLVKRPPLCTRRSAAKAP